MLHTVRCLLCPLVLHSVVHLRCLWLLLRVQTTFQAVSLLVIRLRETASRRMKKTETTTMLRTGVALPLAINAAVERPPTPVLRRPAQAAPAAQHLPILPTRAYPRHCQSQPVPVPLRLQPPPIKRNSHPRLKYPSVLPRPRSNSTNKSLHLPQLSIPAGPTPTTRVSNITRPRSMKRRVCMAII